MKIKIVFVTCALLSLNNTNRLIAQTKTSGRQSMFKHAYADVNGVRLHYVSAGNPHGKLVLFAHGFPEFWYAWNKQLSEFGRDYYAVALDMRGYNLSSKPADVKQYTMNILVEDLRALAEQLQSRSRGKKAKANRFILIGHDWGGAVAWAFAATHPDLIEKLVIINAPHPAVFIRELRDNPEQQKASSYVLLFRSPQAEAVLSANNYSMLSMAVLADGLKKGYLTEDDRKAYLEAWSQPGALTGGLNYYRAAQIGPPAGDSNAPPTESGSGSFNVNVPTLVIWGEKDPYLLTGNLNGLEKFVPRLTIKRISDAAHSVIQEKSQLVNKWIRMFLKEPVSK